ncbi:MFS transporter [Kribbella sp. NPDC056861]|uniref:MFS transporter n=1 Tax=Kribbella sp. NPDC056861 TaxID=3154857 RepID=UPI00342D6583
MTTYREVLGLRGMTPLLAISLLARCAITADVMALTMYVVLALGKSYAAAGLVAAAITVGVTAGGPLLGRLIDVRGLRFVLLTTSAVQLAFWLCVPHLSFPALLAAALVAGLGMVPVQAVTRQAIAVMTSGEQRRPAFALESIQGELSYLVGPPVVIVAATNLSPEIVAWGIGALVVAGGLGIALLNPPVSDNEQSADATRRPRREWLTTRLTAVLVMAFGTTVLLSAIDLAIVATLRASGQVSWAAIVVAVYGISSVIGGLVYGSLVRPFPTWLLLSLLGLATLPAALADTWPWLCLAGTIAGLLTAPTLSTIADAVSQLAPPHARGEATGLQSSALSAGFALGSPAAGAAIDLFTPAAGFVTAALAAFTTALIGYLLLRPSRSQQPTSAATVTCGDVSGYASPRSRER